MIYRNRIPAVPVFLCQEPVNGIADGTAASRLRGASNMTGMRKNYKKKKNVTKIVYLGRMTGIIKFVNEDFSLFYIVCGNYSRTLRM